MVLEKLGSSLRDTLAKIAKSVFVDEKLINELVRDIQRALLQADVNVQLVFNLSNKIKERITKEETPPGLTKKEYLIKIVYEELTNFLGKKAYDIEITKKPTKIMLVGLFGNGKCVHKDSNILLWNGQTTTIKRLYDTYKEKGEHGIEDGSIVPLENELYASSLNTKTLKIEKKRISYLWKLKAKQLYELKLDNGNNFCVKTTPEHPFFILNDGVIKQKRADELKIGEYVCVPVNYVSEPRELVFKESIKNLNIDVYLDYERIKDLKKKIITKYGTLQKAVNHLPYKRNYASFTHLFKQGQVPIYFHNLRDEDKIKIKSCSAQNMIGFPTKLTPKLAEFIGYIIGDGYISKNSIHIHNEDKEIIENVIKLSEELFFLKVSLTRDKRTKRLIHMRLNSSTLVELINNLFNINIGKKGRKLEIPRMIQESSLDVISYYLRAYFDCDAYFSPKQRQIELVSESQILIKQLQHMFLRFNILGVQIKKKIKGKYYYRFLIQGRHALTYAEKIGSSLLRKKKVLEKYELMTIKQGDGKQDMIPVGSLLNELREGAGYSINQIQKQVSSYGLYERKGWISKTQLRKVISVYEKKEKGNFAKLVELINNKEVKKLQDELSQPLINALVGKFKNNNMIAAITNSPTKLVLTEKGQKYLKKIEKGVNKDILKTLKNLAHSDLSWIKVSKISKAENDSSFVYDLTVEDNHNFIADGIIVHNTTTAGKLGKFFQKRGNKVALISTDTWRPAAFKQLQQLGKQLNIPVFGNPEEKDPVKIYRSFEPKFKDFDLVIIDTAGRDALSADLVKEIEDINEAVNADERLLVIGADLGQAAQTQAQQFHDSCNVTGVIATKMDGTAKAGGALSACAVTDSPIKFIGVGEKIDDLEKFNPERFVGRLLGMGDLETLLEKAKEAISEDQAEDLSKRFLKGKFNLIDLYDQMQAMSKMGSMGKLMEMIPGFSQIKLPKDLLQVQEGKLKKWKFIMNSCTKKELEDPDLMSPSRIDRISVGSGCSTTDVRELLKQYKQGKKMAKMMGGGSGGSMKGMERMMKKMGKGGMPNMKFK